MRTIPADGFSRANQHNSAWQRAHVEAGYRICECMIFGIRGMRLREAGVPESTIADILWHTRIGMTAHYSVAQEVFDALERIINENQRGNRTLAMIAREARGV